MSIGESDHKSKNSQFEKDLEVTFYPNLNLNHLLHEVTNKAKKYLVYKSELLYFYIKRHFYYINH